jgi:peptide/nickel transport system permease protein
MGDPERRRPVIHRARGSEGASYIISGEWWAFMFPGAALVLAVFCFNMLGDGLRDLLDPRKRV